MKHRSPISAQVASDPTLVIKVSITAHKTNVCSNSVETSICSEPLQQLLSHNDMIIYPGVQQSKSGLNYMFVR